MYNATKWLDKVVDVDSGEVIQAGTDQSAAHFNNMESGITDASVATAMLLIAAGELQSQTEIERHVVELKNTASYPFNNSTKTVSLAITRDNTDYTVDGYSGPHRKCRRDPDLRQAAQRLQGQVRRKRRERHPYFKNQRR